MRPIKFATGRGHIYATAMRWWAVCLNPPRNLESSFGTTLQQWSRFWRRIASQVSSSGQRDRGDIRIRARKGVVLATGGFARHASWSQKYLPSANDWTVSPRTNQGDGIQIGLSSGGKLPAPLGENAALWSPISEIRPRQGPPRTYPHFSLFHQAGLDRRERRCSALRK